MAAISRSGRSVNATTSSAPRLTLNRASAWLTCSGSSPRVCAVEERTSGTAGKSRMSGCSPGAPPRSAAARPLFGPGHHRPTEHGGRRIVGMSLELRGQLDQLDRRAASSLLTRPLRPRARRPRPTPTSRDPRECGMALRHTTSRPGPADNRRLQPALDGPHDQMRRAQGNVLGALPLDPDRQPGIGCFDNDLVVQAQRQTQAVEARAEVGAGRRHRRSP